MMVLSVPVIHSTDESYQITSMRLSFVRPERSIGRGASSPGNGGPNVSLTERINGTERTVRFPYDYEAFKGVRTRRNEFNQQLMVSFVMAWVQRNFCEVKTPR